MAKALVTYTTRSGNTRSIGELIAEGLRMGGIQASVKNSDDIKNEKDLEGYDAYIFGSATYHGDMMNGIKTILFLCEKISLEGKTGGAFGAFGWSGEAPDRIYQTMKNIYKMNMVPDPLRLKSPSLEGGIKMAQDYGRDIARKITS